MSRRGSGTQVESRLAKVAMSQQHEGGEHGEDTRHTEHGRSNAGEYC